MLTKGYEEEILVLLKKMKMRKDQKTQIAGIKRSKIGSSRFDRGLRRLEYSIKFKGSGSGKVHFKAMLSKGIAWVA